MNNISSVNMNYSNVNFGHKYSPEVKALFAKQMDNAFIIKQDAQSAQDYLTGLVIRNYFVNICCNLGKVQSWLTGFIMK